MSRRVVTALGALAVAVVVLVGGGLVVHAAGGGGSDGSASSVAVAPQPAADGAAGAAAAGAPEGAGSNGSLSYSATLADPARDVVRTAQLAVTTDDPAAAADRAGRIADAAGGRIDRDTRGDRDRGGSATLVLRVPATALDTTLSDLAALGDETSRQVGGDDVTAQTADLGARISALQTSVDRLQTLIGTSGSLSDLLAAETQLTQRQSDLESLQAQQRALADQVALATVTVTLVAPSAAAPGADPTGFGAAVASGWHGFTLTLRYLVAGLGYALPVLVLLALSVGVVVVVRRRRAHRPAPPAPVDPAPGTS